MPANTLSYDFRNFHRRIDVPRKVRKGRPRQDDTAVVSPLRDSPSFLVRLVQLTAFDEFHHHFAGLSMTPGRFSVFALIANNPGIRPGTISEELRVKPSNVAVIVNTLAAERLVERRQDRMEMRANALYPTKTGLKVYQKMWDIHRDLDKLLLSPLSVQEQTAFVEMLRKLNRTANKLKRTVFS
jgi:DNA-binding MarR family transcriptional regulator